jgi:hypothetical protein
MIKKGTLIITKHIKYLKEVCSFLLLSTEQETETGKKVNLWCKRKKK